LGQKEGAILEFLDSDFTSHFDFGYFKVLGEQLKKRKAKI